MTAFENEDPSSGDDDGPSRPAKRARQDAGPRTTAHDQTNGADAEGPACQSCRRKKAKCSREQPCSACTRYGVDCVYDDRKAKPGLRTGAVENLSQRVATLEHMFLGQGVLWQQVFNHLGSLAGSDGSSPDQDSSASGPSLRRRATRVRSTLSAVADGQPPDASLPQWPSSRQPGSSEMNGQPHVQEAPGLVSEDADADALPPPDLVDALVEIYFVNIHIWIPMLHVYDFRKRMSDPEERPRLRTIFHAVVSSCARFSDDPRLGTGEAKARLAKRSRQAVILESMETFSVESLQALIICAFDTVGATTAEADLVAPKLTANRLATAEARRHGMTRTVEQLQLSVEDEDLPSTSRVLIKRMAFLPPCRNWSEREERRRVFWNTFLLDRFCSIATGWNLSLTSADVKRRLPCEGALWEAGEPLRTPTPYFGVADKSGGTAGALPTARPEGEAQDSLGGFAYCIEATESLSLVTSFFLQQGVDVSKPQEVQMWLLKFKQLDLRLVQWKIFLPEQWREACALNRDGILDPNLTLAHISHNTAVVLLHQGIAYPLPDWHASGIRLPSASSAETCLAAATEVAIIADKFLQGSTALTSPQFAFCLFICGRMLLAHSAYYGLPLAAEFDSLVRSLVEMSGRWNGPDDAADNLSRKFARRLLRAKAQGNAMLDLRQPVYSDDPKPDVGTDITNAAVTGTADHMAVGGHEQTYPSFSGMVGFDQDASPDNMSLAFPPLPASFYQQGSSRGPTAVSSPVPTAAAVPGMAPRLGEEQRGMGPAGSYDYGDLSALLDYSFLSTQRISMFSGQQDANQG